MSAFVRYSPELMNRKPTWFLYSTFICLPPITLSLCAPHTFLLKKYQQLVSHSQNGEPVPVPDDLNETFKSVANDVPIHSFYKKFLKVFMVRGFDTFHAGSACMLNGGIIGIPKTFTFKSIDDAKQAAKEILIQEAPVEWDRVQPEVRDKFFNSLIFSEKAIKYAMAYDIALVQGYGYLYSPFAIAFTILMNGIIADFIARKFEFRKKPYSLTFLLAFGMIAMTFCSCISIYNIVKFALGKEANYFVKRMDEEYLEGAIEYWSKLIDRNIALRHLMVSGETKFSPLGKESFILGSPGIPPIDQKRTYEEFLAERRKVKKE